jgi:hypothetical protein
MNGDPSFMSWDLIILFPVPEVSEIKSFPSSLLKEVFNFPSPSHDCSLYYKNDNLRISGVKDLIQN